MGTLAGEHVLRGFVRALLVILLVCGGAGRPFSGGVSAEEVRLETARFGHRAAVEASTQRTRRAPKIADGLIAGFEDGEIGASFGAGWIVNNDAGAGGTSIADMTVVEGGAADSLMSLRVRGSIVRPPGRDAWAGALFFPGRRPWAAVNMSEYEGISFWLRGDGAPVSIALFAQSRGSEPALMSRPTTEVWTEHKLAFSDFSSIDPTGLRGIFFSGDEVGDFEFQVDDLRVW